jgi:hypothetical protein
LPSRFQRIRYYGWQSPNSKLKFQRVQMLVWFYLGWCWLMKRKEVIEPPVRMAPLCSKCKVGRMQLVAITNGEGRIIYRRPLAERGVGYLDSG